MAKPAPVKASSGAAVGAGIPAVVVSTSVLMILSLAVGLLAATGAAHALPTGVRAAAVCLVALTLPGLPVAALLRLPGNGIFGSVTIAVSLTTNILLAQFNFGTGVRQPFVTQLVLLALTGVAVGFLITRWRASDRGASLLATLGSVRPRADLTRQRAVTGVLLVVSVALFGVAVARLDTSAAGAYGLLQIVGVAYVAGLLVVAVALAIEYRRRVIDGPALAAVNVVLITYVTMPVAWSDRTAPFNTAYVHAFITDWMVRLGTLPPPLDARISWAGFFSAAAQLMTVGGLTDTDVFIVDASLVFGILMIFPVYAIGRTISGNPRAAWLGVTVYVSFNWYQQDYFAPQAVAMQFYATLLAVLLWQLRSSPVPAVTGSFWQRTTTAWMRVPGRVEGRDAGWTRAMELVLLLIVAAQVVAHQLTPVATIGALLLFAAFGLTRYKVLWLAAVLLFVSWFTYGASAFWQGHLGEIITDIGGVDQNLDSGVAGHLTADPVYGRMQYLRIAASVVLFASAALGWWRLPRGSLRSILVVLAVAPFGIVLVQSYGGEVAIRCFLYASPILAPLAALVLLPLLEGLATSGRRNAARVVAAAVVFFTLALWLMTDRGLNTSFEHTTPEEVSVSKQLMAQTDNTRIASWGQAAMYGLGKPFELAPSCLLSSGALADCTDKAGIYYVVDSDQDQKFLQYQSGVAPATVRDAVQELLSDKGFQMVYDGHDIRVLKRADAPPLVLGFAR